MMYRRALNAIAPPTLRNTPPLSTARSSSTTASYYQAASAISVSHLIASYTHIGHTKSRWSSSNLPYILGLRHNIHIIDPNQTLSHLRRAANFTRLLAGNSGLIVFVVSNPAFHHIAVDAAHYCSSFYVTHWIPGTLTNTERVVVAPQFDFLAANDATVGDLAHYARKPDLVIAVDIANKKTLCAIKEARKLNIPTMAVIDTDVDPKWVTYPIPGNDDHPQSLMVLLHSIAESIKLGRRGAVDRMQFSLGINRAAVESPDSCESWTDNRIFD